MDLDIQYKMRRIGENLFVSQQEQQKLYEIYKSGNPFLRDDFISSLESQSKTSNYEVRRKLKDAIEKC